jgi:hypothetical protein
MACSLIAFFTIVKVIRPTRVGFIKNCYFFRINIFANAKA